MLSQKSPTSSMSSLSWLVMRLSSPCVPRSHPSLSFELLTSPVVSKNSSHVDRIVDLCESQCSHSSSSLSSSKCCISISPALPPVNTRLSLFFRLSEKLVATFSRGAPHARQNL